MRHIEDQMQQFIVKWFRMKYPKRIITCAPATSKSAREGAKKKKMGYLKGWPDLFIAAARKRYYGLFIELKTQDGSLSKEQRAVIDELEFQGYKAVVCRSIDEAIEIIDKYFN